MTWVTGSMNPVTRYQCFRNGAMRPVLWMVDANRQQTFHVERAVGALLWMGGPGNGGMLSTMVSQGEIVETIGPEPVRNWEELD